MANREKIYELYRIRKGEIEKIYELYKIKRIKNKAYIEQLGERIITIRAKTLVNLQKAMESTIGEEEAKALLYDAFINMGRSTAKVIYRKWKEKGKIFLKKLMEFYDSRGCGWFKLENLDIDYEKLEGNIRIRQSFIAEEYGKSEKPICDPLAGYFVGLFEEIFKKEFMCKEIKCIAKGDKYCEFKIKAI
ncbi:MAG: V4R domain-containing protein [Nitrososphaerota archaeon]